MSLVPVETVAKLGGRKFLVCLFGMLVVAANNALGMPVDLLWTVASLASVYVFGQSIADAASQGATSSMSALKK